MKKIHKGAYTNSIDYTGKYEPKSQSIIGRYGNGSIQLKKTKLLGK